MDLEDWRIASECCLELWTFEKLPKDVQEALRGRYEFTILTWDVVERQGIAIPPGAPKHSIVVTREILCQPVEERLGVLFHEFAHVYLNHGWPQKENAEEKARQLAEHWLELWRTRQAAST